jgi:chorismate mutase
MSKPGQSKNVQEAKKRNNEIINNLKQTLGKPTIVEAQRTLKILERLIDRIAIFLNLDSDFIVKFNETNNSQKLKLNKALLQELSPPVLDLLVKEAKMEL